MGKALSEPTNLYSRLFDKGVRHVEEELFNGEYFFQNIEWKNKR
jgi:hypothetical protein